MTIAVSEKRDIASLIFGRGVPFGLEHAFPYLKVTADGPIFDITKLENAPDSVLGGIWKAQCVLEKDNDDARYLKTVLKKFDHRDKREIEYRKAEDEYVNDARRCRRATMEWDAWEDMKCELTDRINFNILHSLKMLGRQCHDQAGVQDLFDKMRECKQENLMKMIYINKAIPEL